jgi:hypothetical protein
VEICASGQTNTRFKHKLSKCNNTVRKLLGSMVSPPWTSSMIYSKLCQARLPCTTWPLVVILSPWHSLLYNAPNCVLMFSCCWFPNYSATISSRTSCLGDLKASASSGGITYGCEMKKKENISFHAFGRRLYIHHGNLAQVLKHFKFSSILQQPKLLPAYKCIAPHPTCSQRSSPHFLIKYE